MLNKFNNPTTLVIAGAWNPDILSPSWVAREAMGYVSNQDFPVKVEVAISNPKLRPIYEFDNIKFTAASSQLKFFLVPDDLAQVKSSVITASKILELLSHTPVTGFGFNISYEIEDPNTELRNTFSDSNICQSMAFTNATIVAQKWGSSIKMQNYLLSVNASLEGDKVFLQFNAHFEAASSTAASQQLTDDKLFTEIEQVTCEIAQKLNDLEESTQ